MPQPESGGFELFMTSNVQDRMFSTENRGILYITRAYHYDKTMDSMVISALKTAKNFAIKTR